MLYGSRPAVHRQQYLSNVLDHSVIANPRSCEDLKMLNQLGLNQISTVQIHFIYMKCYFLNVKAQK